MRIGELAERVGISTDAIRFYEKQGLIDQSLMKRGDNNYRLFTEEAEEHLLMLKHGRRMGFSLKKLRKLKRIWDTKQLTEETQIQILEEQRQQLENQIEELQRVKAIILEKLAQYER